MIISLLGLSVFQKKSTYKNTTNLPLKNDKFINSTDVLLQSFENERFIFLGTEESVKDHQKIFKSFIEKREVEFKIIDSSNLQDVFLKIMTLLIENKNEEIIFDITHSYRDTVIMSVISTIISQIIYKPNIKMIYAKETKGKQNKEYSYDIVSEEMLNTANIATILSTFLDTLKVPKLHSKYELYTLLNTFSTHLVSNQFKEVYDTDIKALNDYIDNKKDQLFFIKPLLTELQKLLISIKKTEKKETYEQFLFFSELFLEKEYLLHASTFLIEAIPYYIGTVFKDKRYIDFDVTNYDTHQKIIALLKFNYKEEDFSFPNSYFIDINSQTIKEFSDLRTQVAAIRHNLAHINISQEYHNPQDKLKDLLQKLNILIAQKKLYQLDTTLKKQKYTVKYKIEKIAAKTDQFLRKPGTPKAKLETLVKKYKENKLGDLTNYDEVQLQTFLQKHIRYIDTLFEQKKNNNLLLPQSYHT